MIMKNIEEILIKGGYSIKEFTMAYNGEEAKFDFDYVYVNETSTEAYVLIEDYLTKDKIEGYQEKVLCFQNWCDNNILIYNINLILIYTNGSINKEIRNLIYKYERDGHLCRKIFIDANSKIGDLELDILPFKPLEIVEFKSQEEHLKSSIINILGSVDIYIEMLEDFRDIDIEKFRKNLLV